MREKVAAQTFARGYLTGLVGNVFDKLFEQGYFYDPVEKEVQEEFMPWLQTQVGEAISTEAVSRAAVDAVIEAAQTRAVAQRVRCATSNACHGPFWNRFAFVGRTGGRTGCPGGGAGRVCDSDATAPL